MFTTREATPLFDARLGKFSQACTFVLTGLAFVVHLPVIVFITTVLLALSVLVPAIGPYRLVYRHILVPLRILQQRMVEDDPAPHRFAQGVATVFLLASTLVLYLSHATLLGWMLDLIVFVLSGINLFVGFCLGCFVYYHLGRLGIMPRVRYKGSFHWRGV